MINAKVDFIPKEWQEYSVFFDNKCEHVDRKSFDLVKFMIADYFYLYINPKNLNIYNVSPNIKKLLKLDNDGIPKHISDFIGYIHPDDYEFIEFAEKWGFEKIISSRKIDKLKLTYVIRFKVSDESFEYFHHQTYYELNSLTNKICCCVAFNTKITGFTKEVEKGERVVMLLDVETLDVVDRASFYPSKNPLIDKLTIREKEIIIYITRGFTGKEIANKLNVSYHTIRTHHSNINKKLDVKNSVELIQKCNEIGFM